MNRKLEEDGDLLRNILGEELWSRGSGVYMGMDECTLHGFLRFPVFHPRTDAPLIVMVDVEWVVVYWDGMFCDEDGPAMRFGLGDPDLVERERVQ